MKITLKLDSGEKEYAMGRPKARVVKKAIKLATKLDPKNINENTMDEMVNLVVVAFGNQFTSDDMWDGLFYDEVMEVVQDTLKEVVEGTQKRLNQSKNAAAGKAAKS
ncbi:hypothetical protein Q5O14_07890 [Eubacteriaceae bacterium ES2]|nr:hypothetical protein Q5O14_07890 [Eubacteriaceae bacterium ES2]